MRFSERAKAADAIDIQRQYSTASVLKGSQMQADILNAEPTPESYFRSITPAFETTLTAEESSIAGHDSGFTSFIFFLLLLSSIIPILPTLAYLGSHWISKSFILHIWRFDLSIHTFLFWYVALSAITALLFGISLRYSSIKKRRRERVVPNDELLNHSQMRFALCYSVKSEIDSYRTNKLPIHMKKARSFWEKLIPSLYNSLESGRDYFVTTSEGLTYPAFDHRSVEFIGSSRLRMSQRFFPQLSELLTRYSWFKIEPRSEAIIAAFDGLRSKIDGRISDKKDLSQVSRCLEALSFYLYTQIPEISDTEEDRLRINGKGELSLDSFVHEMNSLDKYIPQELSVPTPDKSAAKKAKIGEILSATVGNPSPFLRFCSIWIILQLIVGIAVTSSLLSVRNLKLDSTLLALLIGSPFAIAAALTAVPISSRSGSGSEGK